MSKYFANMRGRQHEWRVDVAEASVEDMRADGIEVFEAVYTIPGWVADLGLTRPWCIMQDIWDAPTRIWKRIKRKNRT
jgi:hypothetical protein